MSDHPLHYAAPPPHPHSHYAVAYQHPPHAPPPLMHPQPVAYAQAAVAGAVHVSPDAPYAHPHHPYPYAHAAPAAHAPPRHEYGLVSAEPAGVRRPPSVLKASRMTSQFVGVHRSGKKRKPWTSACYWQGKQYHLGYFMTEEEAARVYDKFVREKNLARRINFPESAEKVQPSPQAKVPSRNTRKTASKYIGVHQSASNPLRPWRASCMSKRRHYHLGVYATEKEAALAYDNFVREHGLEREINFPELAPVRAEPPPRVVASAPVGTYYMPGPGAYTPAPQQSGQQPYLWAQPQHAPPPGYAQPAFEYAAPPPRSAPPPIMTGGPYSQPEIRSPVQVHADINAVRPAVSGYKQPAFAQGYTHVPPRGYAQAPPPSAYPSHSQSHAAAWV